MKKVIGKIFYSHFALLFVRGDVRPWNGQGRAFSEIGVNAQNVLVLTDKTDINKSPRLDVIHLRISSEFMGRIMELSTTI